MWCALSCFCTSLSLMFRLQNFCKSGKNVEKNLEWRLEFGLRDYWGRGYGYLCHCAQLIGGSSCWVCWNGNKKSAKWSSSFTQKKCKPINIPSSTTLRVFYWSKIDNAWSFYSGTSAILRKSSKDTILIYNIVAFRFVYDWRWLHIYDVYDIASGYSPTFLSHDQFWYFEENISSTPKVPR